MLENDDMIFKLQNSVFNESGTKSHNSSQRRRLEGSQQFDKGELARTKKEELEQT